MRKLLNTLYVTSPETYLALDGENLVVRKDEAELIRLPLHNLEAITAFGYTGASPALMGACAKRGIDLCFLTQHGRFLARIVGEVQGNVLLRHKQHSANDNPMESLSIAKSVITGKLYNAKWVIERATRDHSLRLDVPKLKGVSSYLHQSCQQLQSCCDLEQVRGVEGKAAVQYFSVFDDLVLQQKEDFHFSGRNRRPPLDRINALLSFVYTLLSKEIAAALETSGLDPYVGFLHRNRPGRVSLALDLLEELRPVYADRFVLSLINKREIVANDFIIKENGAVLMKDDARKQVLNAWQTRKQTAITHPFLNEKIAWGLVPYAQSMLLARYLRGDLDAYPPFMWK